MKKVLCNVLALVLMVTLFGCDRNANPDTENKLFFQDVMKTMKKNDSFAITVHHKLLVEEAEVGDSENTIEYRFNDYYEDSKREGILNYKGKIEDSGEEMNVTVIRKNQVENIFINEEHTGGFFESGKLYENLEFLKLDRKHIDKLKFKESKKERKFIVNLIINNETYLEEIAVLKAAKETFKEKNWEI